MPGMKSLPVSLGRDYSRKMSEQQPTFKVVDRRPFNPDGTPRELSPEEKKEEEPKPAASDETAPKPAVPPASSQAQEAGPSEQPAAAATARAVEGSHPGRDPLDDPASFVSLIMSLASNAAASLGMMPHPVTGETGVDLKTAKHWIDVLGMLEQKTHGNLDAQEAQMLEGLLADLRMQYVSFSGSPAPPSKFSASDITGGK
jgi:Domain of unknown function (DUF1844)